MNQTKAWQDLMSENKVYRTGHSSWYIDHGVKIEVFDKDNRTEVMNTMTSNDKYEKITEEQMYIFDHIGWLAGCYKVNVDVCHNKLEKIIMLMHYAHLEPTLYNLEYLTERKRKLLIKKDDYSLRLKEILQSL